MPTHESATLYVGIGENNELTLEGKNTETTITPRPSRLLASERGTSPLKPRTVDGWTVAKPCATFARNLRESRGLSVEGVRTEAHIEFWRHGERGIHVYTLLDPAGIIGAWTEFHLNMASGKIGGLTGEDVTFTLRCFGMSEARKPNPFSHDYFLRASKTKGATRA